MMVLANNETRNKQPITSFVTQLAQMIDRDSNLEDDPATASATSAPSSTTSCSNKGGRVINRGNRSINATRRIAALKCKDTLMQYNYQLINEYLLSCN